MQGKLTPSTISLAIKSYFLFRLKSRYVLGFWSLGVGWTAWRLETRGGGLDLTWTSRTWGCAGSMGQELTRIHTFSDWNWPKGVNPCIFPLIYSYQWKFTRIHTFWPKGMNPCKFLTHTLWARNLQGFTHFQMKCQKPPKMKRCESL